MQQNGVVGAGGAGFPSYGKLDKKADTILLNCAECEPLLKLHRQVLEKFAFEILSTLNEIAETVEAERAIVCVKGSYTGALEAVKAHLSSFPKISIHLLPEIYPAGDEVIMIYEATGRVVAPGSIPITVGCVVFNVETVYNIYKALQPEPQPVTSKYITIAGEVKNPITLKAPLGITYEELVQLAGGPTCKEPVYLAGGPMTGSICSGYDVVTKTSNAVLVLPKDAFIIQKRLTRPDVNIKRAMSVCCQCHMCTDLCSRNLLGHPIEPHRFMRAVAGGQTEDTGAFLNSFFCSSCGLCELYSCFQGLSPRSLLAECKGRLRKNGVVIPNGLEPAPVLSYRSTRLVPMGRLTSRLGLAPYNKPAPLKDELVPAKQVKIKMSQHIGAPAVPVVKVGDFVTAGQVVGQAAEGKLSVCIHASISGRIAEATDQFVIIKA